MLITQSGAAPSELESQVTKKIEDAVASLNGVWHIASTVTDGSSSTIVQFNVGSVDIDRALNDVKDQIAKIRADLPRTIDEPIVSRIDIEGLPIVTYAASAPGMTRRAIVVVHRRFGRARICRACTASARSSASAASIARFASRSIREKLLALGVTAAAVNEQVRANNVDLGGGRGEARRPGAGDPHAGRRAQRRRSRRAADRACRADARSGSTNSATVTDGAAEPRTFTRLFDEPIVAFAVTRAKGASDVTVDELISDAAREDRRPRIPR